MRLYIVGIGPGEATQMTQRAQAALERSELIVGIPLTSIWSALFSLKNRF